MLSWVGGNGDLYILGKHEIMRSRFILLPVFTVYLIRHDHVRQRFAVHLKAFTFFRKIVAAFWDRNLFPLFFSNGKNTWDTDADVRISIASLPSAAELQSEDMSHHLDLNSSLGEWK